MHGRSCNGRWVGEYCTQRTSFLFMNKRSFFSENSYVRIHARSRETHRYLGVHTARAFSVLAHGRRGFGLGPNP